MAVVAAAAVAAFVAFGLVVGAVQGHRDSSVQGPHRALVVPSRVDGYVQLTSPGIQTTLARARDLIRNAHGVPAGFGDHALVAAYGASAGSAVPELVFIGDDAADDAGARPLFSRHSPAANATMFTAGARIDSPQDFPTGPLGGVLRCGTASTAAGISACVWFDRSTFGLLLATDGTTVDGLAVTLLHLRSAAES